MAIFKKSKRDVVHNTVVNWRKTAGITQAELARHVGVSRQTIITMEQGAYVPSLLLAMKIANFFNANVEDIFTYEQN